MSTTIPSASSNETPPAQLALSTAEPVTLFYLSVTARTRDRSDGRYSIPFAKFGASVRYSLAELRAHLAEMSIVPAPTTPLLPATPTEQSCTQRKRGRGRPRKVELVINQK